MRKRGLVWLLVILAMVLGACGKDDEDGKKSSLTAKFTVPPKTKNVDEWKLVDVQDLNVPIQAAVLQAYPQYADESEESGVNARLSYPLILAPDGEQVIFMFEARQPDVDVEYYLCRYVIESSEVACQTVSREFFSIFREEPDLAWSPDGKQFALTAPRAGLIMMIDVDLWLIDYPSLETDNLTDDGYNDRIRPGEAESERALLDVTPIWHPTSGDLYFLRIAYRSSENGGPQWGWYRLKDAQGEPELVYDLTSLTNRYDLITSGEAAISPDGKRLIWSQFIYDDEPVWSVYSLDLTSKSAEPRVILDLEDLRPLLPSWSSLTTEPDTFNPLAQLPESLAFSADGSHLLVKLYSPMYQQFPEIYNVLDLELSSGTITPLMDYESFGGRAELVQAEGETARIPRVLIFSPDSHSLFYTVRQGSGDETQFILWAMPIPFTGEPVQIGPISDVEGLGRSMMRASAAGGNVTVTHIWPPAAHGRVLIGWTLFQFE